MTINDLAKACCWKLLAGEDGIDNPVDGCYVGDLLSWVMGRAQSGNVWLTVIPVFSCPENLYQTAIKVYEQL